MRNQTLIGLVAFGLAVFQPAMAAEREATLLVDNMSCASCPYIVKQSLVSEPGVISVTMSFQDKTARVMFDDSKTSVQRLVKATTAYGYPSKQKK